MADQCEPEGDGLLPEPDPAGHVRELRDIRGGRLTWRRFLPAGLCSVGVHLAFLPFVLLLSVLSVPPLNVTIPSSNDLSDQPQFGAGYAWEEQVVREHPRLGEEERTVATGSAESEVMPQPAAGKSPLVPGRANKRESDNFTEVQGTILAADSSSITIELDKGGTFTCRAVYGTSTYIVGAGVFSPYHPGNLLRGGRVIVFVYSEDGAEIAATIGIVAVSSRFSLYQFLFPK
jgi:hypothetical protein